MRAAGARRTAPPIRGEPMRLVRFETQRGRRSWGWLSPDDANTVLEPVGPVAARPFEEQLGGDMAALVAALAAADTVRHERAALTLLAPIAKPSKIIAVGRNYRAHASLMISAFLVSCVFLCFYLYHKHLLYLATGSSETSTTNVRPVLLRYAYLFLLLLPHVLLAMVMVPMILTTFFFAATRRWAAHKKLARPTFWIWLYVSVTGVLVYFTLYHLFPHFRTGA